MPENAVPDELFDADDHTLADRSDWIVQDGELIRAPVVGDFVPESLQAPSGGRLKHQPRRGGKRQS